VVYPIFDLEQFFTDVHRYVRSLEEVVIATLAEYGVVATRIKGYTGVWLEGTPNRELGRNVDIEEVKAKLLGHFSRIFGFRAVGQ